jgi:hypothetical protein
MNWNNLLLEKRASHQDLIAITLSTIQILQDSKVLIPNFHRRSILNNIFPVAQTWLFKGNPLARGNSTAFITVLVMPVPR